MGIEKAFTFIELLMTLLILAIVAAIATPAFQRYAINSNLKTALRDIASDIALLKERAISENRMYRIPLDIANNRYTLQQCNTLGSPCSAWSALQVKNLTQFAGDIRFDPEATTVTSYFFQPRGMVTNGTIVLRNSRGSTASITINVMGRLNAQLNLQ